MSKSNKVNWLKEIFVRIPNWHDKTRTDIFEFFIPLYRKKIFNYPEKEHIGWNWGGFYIRIGQITWYAAEYYNGDGIPNNKEYDPEEDFQKHRLEYL